MEKKKIIILIVIVVLIGIINLAHRGKAYDYYLQYFSVDKDLYYNDETIHINASWNLDYTPPAETSYIYIKIFNATETLWTSEFHSEIGENLTGNWDIDGFKDDANQRGFVLADHEIFFDNNISDRL